MNLTVEKLEDRLLLAGNVTTSFKNGTLTIKGDNSRAIAPQWVICDSE